MERESFENADIGKIMNDNFVCIKVDREERPDVDRVYMTFVQVCYDYTITGSGCMSFHFSYTGTSIKPGGS